MVSGLAEMSPRSPASLDRIDIEGSWRFELGSKSPAFRAAPTAPASIVDVEYRTTPPTVVERRRQGN
jgi:hypothetical protein